MNFNFTFNVNFNFNVNSSPNGRFGAAFLVRVGQLETQLYDSCLGDEEENDNNNTARDTTASSLKGGVPIKEAVRSSEGGEGDRGEEKAEGGVGEEETVPDAEEEADMEEGRAGLYGMLLVLCSELHKNLRPRVYHGTDMDTLCEVRGCRKQPPFVLLPMVSWLRLRLG